MKFIPKRKSLTVVLAVFILLVFLHSLNILNPLEKALFNIFAPVQKYFYSSGLKAGDFIENIKERKDESATELLKAQIRSLLVQNAKLKIFAEENKLLKKALGFQQKHSYELISARVIGSDSLQNSTLLILQIENKNYNTKDVEIDMPIVVEDNILVGKIASIKQDQIYMLPITASQSAIAATILNKNYTLGVAEGELNQGVKMRMIPQSEKLKQGGLVVTSGLETKMPRGLLLGTISKVSHDPQTPFDVAHVAPLYNLKRLSKILIIKKY